MKLTFDSRHLERRVSLADLPTLPETELRELYCELTMAIQVMQERIHSYQTNDPDFVKEPDRNWLDRVRKKLRICNAFCSQVSDAIAHRRAAETLYLMHLERLGAEEVGQEVWNEIRRDAQEAALKASAVPQPTTQAA